jgi:hypothetical protein
MRNDKVATLLEAIDWVHRTGWRNRQHDDATARWVFDGWRGNEGRSDTRPLLTALQEVFQDFYDHDDAKHLCNLYEIIFNA